MNQQKKKIAHNLKQVDPLRDLLEVLQIHRGLSTEQAVTKLYDELCNMNGMYAVLGRLPSEVIDLYGCPPTLRRGLDSPPNLVDGRVVEPPPA